MQSGNMSKSPHIAILGAGPAGLSCAYQLALRGYSVTVFEAFSKPGGMLRYGIPDYRLPTEVLDKEIKRIEVQESNIIGQNTIRVVLKPADNKIIIAPTNPE